MLEYQLFIQNVPTTRAHLFYYLLFSRAPTLLFNCLATPCLLTSAFVYLKCLAHTKRVSTLLKIRIFSLLPYCLLLVKYSAISLSKPQRSCSLSEVSIPFLLFIYFVL